MKIGIKLHNYRSTGRIDTFQIKKSPYTADHHQACQILDAIQQHHQRPSKACLARLATFVAQSWESTPSDKTIHDISRFMNNLLNTTGDDPTIPLNESIRKCCSSQSPVPTVCPGVTLLFAIQYIDRLNQNYKDIMGAHGCSRRLVLVAYIIAAKYIQSNLKLIVDTHLPPPLKKNTSPPNRSLPISPPVSPRALELTEPTQYHYFQSTKRQTTSTQSMNNIPSLSPMCSQFNYRVWRMENEFLHFLNDDLRIPNCRRWVDWANRLSSSSTSLLPDIL